MSRKRLTEEQKKTKTAISLDENLFNIMEEYLEENKYKRSKYIEKLIYDDMLKRNIITERKF
jgi:metal-responsive CopG/Arc/MetJ family transcriptional regulator